MDSFALHTLRLLHSDALHHYEIRDKSEEAVKNILSHIQTDDGGISEQCKTALKDILSVAASSLTDEASEAFAYMEVFDKVQPMVVVCVEELYRLYGMRRVLLLEKLRIVESREELEEEDLVVLQMLDPACIMKSGQELEFGLEAISATYTDLFDLSLAMSNLHDVRMILLVLYCFREILVKQYAFSVVSREVADWIAQQRYSTLLELGCGKGYWAHELKLQGVNVIAQDKQAPATNDSTNRGKGFSADIVTSKSPSDLVQELSASSALLFCWVPKQDIPSFTTGILEFCGQHLLLVGDRALCYSPSFARALHENYFKAKTLPLPRWLGVLDVFEVWQRKDTYAA